MTTNKCNGESGANLTDLPRISDGRLTRCRLGDFLKKDIVKPVLLPLYPTSQINTNYPLKNINKYQTMEFPFYSLDTAAVKTMKTLATVGSEVPVLVFEIPKYLDSLRAHWRKYIPYYEECTDIRLLNDKSIAAIDDGSLFTLQPCEQLPVEKLTINPDTFYEIYSKLFIHEIKINYPRSMGKEEARAPCVIKVPVSQTRCGVKIATTDEEIHEYEEWISKKGWEGELIYQELLTDIKIERGFQSYLRKDGSVHIGCFYSPCFDSSTNVWSGGIYCNAPDDDAEKIRFFEFLKPAYKKLREIGFFGYVSFDVMEKCNGELFLLDINPRIGGSNQHMSMIDGMREKGFPISMYIESGDFTITVEELLSRANRWNQNNESVVIILAARATSKGTLLTAISIFARNKDHLLEVKESAFKFFQNKY